MNKTLYVGNISYTVTDKHLTDLFSQHGKVVSVTLISDRFTGEPRGFGFVEMGSSEEAQKAMQALNGTELEGRAIVVNEARSRERRERPSGGPREKRRFGDRPRRRW